MKFKHTRISNIKKFDGYTGWGLTLHHAVVAFATCCRFLRGAWLLSGNGTWSGLASRISNPGGSYIPVWVFSGPFSVSYIYIYKYWGNTNRRWKTSRNFMNLNFLHNTWVCRNMWEVMSTYTHTLCAKWNIYVNIYLYIHYMCLDHKYISKYLKCVLYMKAKSSNNALLNDMHIWFLGLYMYIFQFIDMYVYLNIYMCIYKIVHIYIYINPLKTMNPPKPW